MNRLDHILRLDPLIRYAAIRSKDGLEMKSKEGLLNESDSESDKYEELLVNPTLLKLAEERGDIDCGGLDYLLVKYGSFFSLLALGAMGMFRFVLKKATGSSRWFRRSRGVLRCYAKVEKRE